MTQVIIEPLYTDSRAPTRGTDQATGWDLYAHISGRERRTTILIPRNTTTPIDVGWKIKVPWGFYMLICSRSGLAAKSIFVSNAPGVIDSDYRGPILVLLYNGGLENHWVQHNDRIAQMILCKKEEYQLCQGEVNVNETGRGAKGFGSTGR